MKRVVAIGDLHCGHRAGLTPPGFFSSKSETPYIHSLQREMWERYSRLVRAYRSPDLLIVNGDSIEGKGTRSGGTELIVSDLIEQRDMALKCIQPWNAKRIVMTYGTACHVSTTSGEDIETLVAEPLGAEIKSHAFIDVDGVIFDVKHHLGSSAIPHGRHTAMAREKLWNFLWNEIDDQPKSNVIIRSHVHYHTFCGGPNWIGLTLPALQAAHTKYGARRCSGVVDWGIATFNIDKKEIASWQVHVQRLVSAKSEVVKI